jgi:hypothetical protein
MNGRWARVNSQEAADWLMENVTGRYAVAEYTNSWIKRGHARIVLFDNEIDKTWFLLRWGHEGTTI